MAVRTDATHTQWGAGGWGCCMQSQQLIQGLCGAPLCTESNSLVWRGAGVFCQGYGPPTDYDTKL